MKKSHTMVYAATDSRLHADLVIVRLKQVGVETSRISIIHPRSMRPNSAMCWMVGSALLPLSSGELVVVCGSLGRQVSDCDLQGAHARGKFRMLGLSHEQSASLEESLLEDHIVIATEVNDDSDLPAIYDTLCRLGVRKINTVETGGKNSAIHQRARWFKPDLAPVALARRLSKAA